MTINDLLIDFVQDLPIGISEINEKFLDDNFNIKLLEKSYIVINKDDTGNTVNYSLDNTLITTRIYYQSKNYTYKFSFEGYIYMQKVLAAYFNNILKGFNQIKNE